MKLSIKIATLGVLSLLTIGCGEVTTSDNSELIVSNYNETPRTESQTLKGKELFQPCAGCHGGKGEKLALGKSKRIAGVNKEVLLYQLEQYKNGDLDLYGMGQLMKLQVVGLSHRELELVSEYVSKL